MPSMFVYFVSPRFIAAIAASLMLSGVSKSGSPAASPMTSRPAAFSSRDLWVIASVGEGLMRFSARAMNPGGNAAMNQLRWVRWRGDLATWAHQRKAGGRFSAAITLRKAIRGMLKPRETTAGPKHGSDSAPIGGLSARAWCDDRYRRGDFRLCRTASADRALGRQV